MDIPASKPGSPFTDTESSPPLPCVYEPVSAVAPPTVPLPNESLTSSTTTRSSPNNPISAIAPTPNDHVSVTLTFSKTSAFKWHRQNWLCKVPPLPTSTHLSDLPNLLKGLVKRRIETDVYMKRCLATGKSLLSLFIDLKVPGNPHLSRGVSLNQDPRIEKLGDVFLDLDDERGLAVEVRVGMQIHRTQTAPTTLNDQILVLWPPATDDYLPYRVGNVPIFDESAPLGELQSFRFGPRSDGPSYSQPLIAWYNHINGDVLLSRCHAYDFEDFCVGDLEEWTVWSRVRFSNKFHFLGGSFEGVRWKGQTKEEFRKRLRAFVEEGEAGGGKDGCFEQLGSGVPFLPGYCWNGYRKEVEQEEVGWTDYGIDIAVRCINKLSSPDTKHISFPRDIRLVILEEDTFQDLEEFVKEAIAVTGTMDGVKVDSGKLFERKHVGRWKLEFWVMPQREKRKLYRFEEGDGKLNRFLSGEKGVRGADKKLFLEVHVVGRD